MTTNTNATVSQVTIATQKLTVEAEYMALISGFATDLPGVDPIVLLRETYARAALLATFRSRIDASQATKQARAALRALVANEKALAAKVEPVRQAMKAYLVARFGKRSPTLQVFGFTEAKAPQKSAASKAEAIAKMLATRKARHIMGKKQRLAITAPVESPDTKAPDAAPVTSSGPVNDGSPPRVPFEYPYPAVVVGTVRE